MHSNMLAALAGALAVYFVLLRPVYNYFRHRANARRLNCQPTQVKIHKLPLGIDHMRRLKAADERDMVCDELFDIYQEQAPTYTHSMLGTTSYFTTEPRNIQAILATQFSDFEIPVIRQQSFWPMLGQGIFTANGQIWSHSRAMLRPQFTRQQVADLELEEKHVQQLLMHIKTNQATGWAEPANLGPLFFRLTIDSATEFLFGQSVESQLQALPGGVPNTDRDLDWKSLTGHFDDCTRHIASRGRLLSLYWLHNPAEFKEDCSEVHRFADYFVQQALKRTDAEEKAEAAGTGEKKRYVFLHELVKEIKDPIELRCQLLHILLAGRDTTAGLLGWTFFLLARHPEIYQKLRNTLIETFGPYESPRDITFERLKGCTYLQHVMQEVLRLYPSVPFNSRMATKDTCLPTGGGPDGKSPVYIEKGRDVNYAVYVMHRRKDLWGPDAEEFNPSRWEKRKAGWEYLPFNGGPRICLGQQFALTEAGYVTTRLVQYFDQITPLRPQEWPKHQYSVTSAPMAVDVHLHTSHASQAV